MLTSRFHAVFGILSAVEGPISQSIMDTLATGNDENCGIG